MGIEKRQHHRLPIQLNAEVRGKTVFQSAKCYNLSQGGMFLATEKIENPGSKLEITFEIEGERRRVIQAEAIVRWTRTTSGACDDGSFLPPGMGVQFVKVFPSNGIKLLERMIEERREKNE